MIAGYEQTQRIWQQINEELQGSSITSVDTSSGNLHIYVAGRKNEWVLVIAGRMSIASNPALPDEMGLSPEFFVGHFVNQIMSTYTEPSFFDVDQENKFVSIDNASIELLGQQFSFMLQCEKFGFSMVNDDSDK
jgi:hypothetical protein